MKRLKKLRKTLSPIEERHFFANVSFFRAGKNNLNLLKKASLSQIETIKKVPMNFFPPNLPINNNLYFFAAVLLSCIVMYSILRWNSDKLTKDEHETLVDIFKKFQKDDVHGAMLTIIELAESKPEIKKLITLFEQRKSNEALRLADELFEEKWKLKIPYLIIKSNFLVAVGQHDKAIQYLNECLDLNPNEGNEGLKSVILFNKGLILDAQGKVDLANELFNEARKLNHDIDKKIVKHSNIAKYIDHYIMTSYPFPSKARELSKDNSVTIRIWEAQGNLDVGHVSLETSEHYISIWPAEAIDKKNALGHVKAIKHSYFEDLKKEGRLPEYKCTFYSIDAEAINKKYKEKEFILLKKSKQLTYSLLSSNHHLFLNEHTNCCKMVTELFLSGIILSGADFCSMNNDMINLPAAINIKNLEQLKHILPADNDLIILFSKNLLTAGKVIFLKNMLSMILPSNEFISNDIFDLYYAGLIKSLFENSLMSVLPMLKNPTLDYAYKQLYGLILNGVRISEKTISPGYILKECRRLKNSEEIYEKLTLKVMDDNKGDKLIKSTPE